MKHQQAKNPHEYMHYLRKLLKGSCCFLVLIRGPSNNNHRPVQRQHKHLINDMTNCAHRQLHKSSVESYQQFMLALAIPPRAWMSPGPDTTRQAPGLDTSNHRRQCKVQTDPSCSHYSFQLLNVLPPSEVSNGRCCITCLLSDRIYCILIYHCSYSIICST